MLLPEILSKGFSYRKLRGNVLKLDSNYAVMSARHGSELSDERRDVYDQPDVAIVPIVDVLAPDY